jgi:hypothetical protein
VAGRDLDHLNLCDLIVPAGTAVPDERPADAAAMGGEQLARLVDAAAALLVKVVEAHRERAFPLRVPHLRSLVVALAAVQTSAREVVGRVRRDAAHWVTLPADDDRAPRWTGATPADFDLSQVPPGNARAELLKTVNQWGGTVDADLDVSQTTLLQLASLLSVWDQPARPIVEPVAGEEQP